MANKISRRDLFKNAAVASAATLLSVPALGGQSGQAGKSGQTGNGQSTLEKILAQSSKTLLAEHEDYFVELAAGDLLVTFGRRSVWADRIRLQC